MIDARGLAEGMRLAAAAIVAHRARAGLTIAGVAVGVLVVVVMAAAVGGVNAAIARDFEAAGPTSFIVARTPISFEDCDRPGARCPWRRNPPITLDDADVLAALPGIAGVVAQGRSQAAVRRRGVSLPSVRVDALSAGWPEVDGSDVILGRSFTPAEATSGARVALLSDALAAALFDARDPIGRAVAIGGARYEVVGVYRPPPGVFGGGDDPRAVVPFRAGRRDLAFDRELVSLTVRPRAGVPRDDAVDAVVAALRARRGVRPGAESPFAIVTQDQLFDAWNALTGAFFVVLLALASVGLFVGGVGVVAVMTIAVTERTREIGVRRALGATRGTILWQFLVEAVALTAAGAVAGLAVGWVAAAALRALTPVEAVVPGWAVLVALAGSAATGVVCGIAPAVRAASLDPVAALRHE